MKRIFLILNSLFVISCSEAEVLVSAPSITGIEVGSDNSKVAFPSSDLHFEAQILAEGIIEKVEVSIHKVDGGGWEFKQDFSEGLQGQRNGELHKHVNIPGDAALGFYHVQIVVTDKQGKTAEVKSELELKNDPSTPVSRRIGGRRWRATYRSSY